MTPQEVANAVLDGAARTQTDLRSTLDLTDDVFDTLVAGAASEPAMLALVALAEQGTTEVAPDGAVLVSDTVTRILYALANAWEAEGERVEHRVRERLGDYLADLEGHLEDVPAQLRLLASGQWGAGTTPGS